MNKQNFINSVCWLFLYCLTCLIMVRKNIQVFLMKKKIHVCIYIYYIYISKRNSRYFASFSQWLHIDHNKLLKRRHSNKSSLSDWSAANWQHFSLHAQFHTHRHTQIHLPLLCSRTQSVELWSSKPPACHLLLPMNCAVQISKAPKGVLQRILPLHFRGTELDPSEEYRKNCTPTNLEATADTSPRLCHQALHCAYLGRLWQSIWECRYLVTGCIAPNLSLCYQH